MKEPLPIIPGFLQRTIATVGSVLVTGLILWWLIAKNRVQFGWILSGVVLTLLWVFFGAVWRHGFRWLFCRCALRFHGWLVVSLFTAVIFFYTEESWRGKRAWAALQREASARGESLEFTSLAAPALPDDQDFAQAPGIADLIFRNQSDPFYHGTQDNWPSASWAWQQSTDLAKWQTFFRNHPEKPTSIQNPTENPRFPVTPEPQTPAADVLFALTRYETNLATLRAASERTIARFPLDYRKGFYVQIDLGKLMNSLGSAVHLLNLRASAELALEQAETALRDILLAVRLAEVFREEPLVLGNRQGMLAQTLQPIWEGLAAHRWNNQQLAHLQKTLFGVDLLADYRRGVQGETLLMMNMVDQFLAMIAGQPTEFMQRHAPNETGERFLHWIVRAFYPVGWLYQDKTWIYRFYERHADPFQGLALRNQPRDEFQAELRTISDPMLVVFLLPHLRETFEDVSVNALMIQSFLQQAATACALERFRLSQGQYPTTIDALVPSFLTKIPADILARTPSSLNYRRTEDGGFLLYSVGANRVDDGGMPRPVTYPRNDHRNNEWWRLSEGNSDFVWIQPGRSRH